MGKIDLEPIIPKNTNLRRTLPDLYIIHKSTVKIRKRFMERERNRKNFNCCKV